jgi:hypothetical protein
MAKCTEEMWRGKHLFVGIDMHRVRWHITIFTQDGLKLFSNYISGNCSALAQLLDRYNKAKRVSAVYEAGYFGFWLYDFLRDIGVDAHVTPPNLIPVQAGVESKRIEGTVTSWQII